MGNTTSGCLFCPACQPATLFGTGRRRFPDHQPHPSDVAYDTVTFSGHMTGTVTSATATRSCPA